MMKAEIARRVSRRVGALAWTPQMEHKVLQSISGQTKPKARLRPAVVLALALLLTLLLAAAAAALLGWQPFGERVIKLEPGSLHGFRGWPLQSKLALVKEMQEMGLDVSEFSGVESMGKEEQDSWLTARLEEYWQGELAYASGNILEKVRGPFYAWSLEDKAWFSQQLLENNRLGQADEINLLPGPEDFTREEAIKKAEALLLAAYGHIHQQTLARLTPAVAFYRLQTPEETRFWKVEYRDDVGAIQYSATFQADGTAPSLSRMPTPEEAAKARQQTSQKAESQAESMRRLEAEKGDALFWSLQEKAELLGASLPGPEDLPLKEARALALSAIVARFDITMEALEALPWGVYFMKYQTQALNHADYYAFTFVLDEKNLYSVGIDARTGETVLLQGPGEGNG